MAGRKLSSACACCSRRVPQGGNIITWCQPFRSHGGMFQQQQQEEEDEATEETPQGMDLALSFQDTAACREIWQRISEAQSRAKEASGRRDDSGGDAG